MTEKAAIRQHNTYLIVTRLELSIVSPELKNISFGLYILLLTKMSRIFGKITDVWLWLGHVMLSGRGILLAMLAVFVLILVLVVAMLGWRIGLFAGGVFVVVVLASFRGAKNDR